MPVERMTVAGAYDKIEGHEALCAERYSRIHESIDEIKGGMRWIIGGLATIVMGLLAWMAVQLYSLEPLRIAAAARPVPAPTLAPASSPNP